MHCFGCHRDGLSERTRYCPECGADFTGILPSRIKLHDGKYIIDSVLGRGGFGITYCGIHDRLGGKVAVKEFYPQHLVERNTATWDITIRRGDERDFQYGRQKFNSEGKKLVQIHHPNVVRAIDLFDEHQTTYLVMDFIDGYPLRRELNEAPGNRLPVNRVRDVMSQLVAALDTVHGSKIYHLDLKPDNVMVDRNGRVILIDFGTARQADRGDSAKTTSPTYTVAYASPELLDERPAGSYSDVFALGVMLYEMLLGKLPPDASKRKKRRC